MAYTNPVVGKTGKSTSPSKRGQASELASRIGQPADKELNLPICVTCSTQTSYAGEDLQAESDDSPYKW